MNIHPLMYDKIKPFCKQLRYQYSSDFFLVFYICNFIFTFWTHIKYLPYYNHSCFQSYEHIFRSTPKQCTLMRSRTRAANVRKLSREKLNYRTTKIFTIMWMSTTLAKRNIFLSLNYFFQICFLTLVFKTKIIMKC